MSDRLPLGQSDTAITLVLTEEEALAVYAVLNQPDIPNAAESVREQLKPVVVAFYERRGSEF